MSFVEPGTVLFVDSDGVGTLLVWYENGKLHTDLIDANRGGTEEFKGWCGRHGITHVQRLEYVVGAPEEFNYGGELTGTSTVDKFVEWWESLL